MKFKKALSGFTPWIIVGVVLVALIIFIGYSKGAFAKGSITSATAKTEGCTKVNQIPISIKGIGYSKDIAWFGVIAEPDKISIEQVTAGGIPLRAIASQDYTWTAKLYDDFTGNLVRQDGGTNTHPGGDVLTEDKFSLNFFINDNNCDDLIDNFEGNIVYEVRTEDGETSNIAQKISFVQGKLVR